MATAACAAPSALPPCRRLPRLDEASRARYCRLRAARPCGAALSQPLPLQHSGGGAPLLAQSSAEQRSLAKGLLSRRRPWPQRRPARPAQASGAAGAEAFPAAGSGSTLPQQLEHFRGAFWKFVRPHTIRGTLLGTTAVVARALIENSYAVDWVLLPRALRGLLALLCGNGYIVGINQVYDADIDRVNKPYLPVAAGELSVPAAWFLCTLLAAVGMGIVVTHFGKLITSLYALGLFLGTIYSVPPFRLKQYALPAFLIIATVRGVLLNFGVYYATRAALRLPFTWSPSIVFITIFVTVFATVIAITKDLPDVEGDRKFKIETFAAKLGVRRIAFLGSGVLLANYIGAIMAAALLPHAFNRVVMMGGHLLLAAGITYQTWLLDASKYTKEAIGAYYRFIWYLFYLEYGLLPFI
eukprot:SM000228S07388  [mRNA]  locus=s228:158642:162445:- [translate_table: standard]